MAAAGQSSSAAETLTNWRRQQPPGKTPLPADSSVAAGLAPRTDEEQPLELTVAARQGVLKEAATEDVREQKQLGSVPANAVALET